MNGEAINKESEVNKSWNLQFIRELIKKGALSIDIKSFTENWGDITATASLMLYDEVVLTETEVVGYDSTDDEQH